MENPIVKRFAPILRSLRLFFCIRATTKVQVTSSSSGSSSSSKRRRRYCGFVQNVSIGGHTYYIKTIIESEHSFFHIFNLRSTFRCILRMKAAIQIQCKISIILKILNKWFAYFSCFYSFQFIKITLTWIIPASSSGAPSYPASLINRHCPCV